MLTESKANFHFSSGNEFNLFYLWFVQVKILIYGGVVCGVITLGKTNFLKEVDVGFLPSVISPPILVEVRFLFWVIGQIRVSLAVSWPLCLIQFCIKPHWCFNLGLCMIVLVSIFILSPTFNFIDLYMILIFYLF